MGEQWLVPEDLLYDRNNYWVKVIGNEAVIGLTHYGQSTTGDVIYLELPATGTLISRGEEFGSIESGKWVGKLVPPVTGEVTATNPLVEAAPGEVNSDPYARGWLMKVRLLDPSELDDLMAPAAYRAWIEEQVRLEQEDAV